MGNCIKKQSLTQWGGDDWSSPSPSPERHFSGDPTRKNSHKQMGLPPFPSTATSSAAGVTEVKIKITKKKLEELLGAVDVQELTVQQMLSQLMNGRDRFDSNRRSWMPALQSIPEVDIGAGAGDL